MNIKFKKISVLFGILVPLILSSMISLSNFQINEINRSNYEEIDGGIVKDDIKQSGIVSPFVIDDLNGPITWQIINSTYDWCSGQGTQNDPYIIEDIVIDAGGTGSGIYVNNSNVYFIIQNCTIYDSSDVNNDAAIRLENVNNSIAINNNCSNNDIGVYLSYCYKNLIKNNLVSNNSKFGMFLGGSFNNTIKNNLILNNSQDGIVLVFCNENDIIGNTIYNNSLAGIQLFFSFDNFISENKVYENLEGIRLNISGYNLIYFNKIFLNDLAGIILEGIEPIGAWNPLGYYNNVSWNLVQNNGDGIVLLGSNYTTVKGNDVKGSNFGIVLVDSTTDSGENTIFGNYFRNSGTLHAVEVTPKNAWDNGFIGNYWDDYGGFDPDGDGIGNNPYVIPITGSTDNRPIYEDPFFNGSKIHIDDTGLSARNWSLTSFMKAWCRGEGTNEFPFIIEDLIINGTGTGSGITIGNSSAISRIENCTIFKTGNTNFPLRDAGIRLINTNYSRIFDNNCSNNGNIGILLLGNCKNNSIDSNFLKNNSWNGIMLDGTAGNCFNNSIINNLVLNSSSTGIYLLQCSNNTISDNVVAKNNFEGIALKNCYENDITDNYAEDNGRGISIIDSSNNSIMENFIRNNTVNGIIIASDTGIAEYNIVSLNLVIDCNDGIEIVDSNHSTIYYNYITNNTGSGIYILSVTGRSEFNLIYRNDFINNTIHAIDNGNNNHWNSSYIGNYWDNYTGVDINPEDGIGDTPYNISGTAKSKDYLPIYVGSGVVGGGGDGDPPLLADDDDDNGKSRDKFNLIEFLTSPIGLTVIGASIVTVMVAIIIKIKGSGKSRLREIERIEKIRSE